MRFKKLKENYITATTFDVVNDVLLNSALEHLEQDEDMSKEERIRYVEYVKQGIENRKKLGEVKTCYKVRKAERDTRLYTNIGVVVGVVISEYGPVLIKHFKNK